MSKSAGVKELKGFVPPARETRKFLTKFGQQLKVAGHQVFVAEINQKPVGFIYLIHEKNFVAIEEVDVMKRYQGRGIGKALVERAERMAKNKGAKYVATGTAINSEGKPWKAYGFWMHLGYKDAGERTVTAYGFKYCKLVKKLQ